MDLDAVVKSIGTRARNDDQGARIKDLATRVEVAFEKARSSGVKIELERDWNALKQRFDAALKKVQKETGLF